MELTEEEKAMLSGERGPALQRAMEIIWALGKIYGAAGTVPVKSAQISGISYKNIGEAGLDFLKKWASEGAKVQIPAMMNPAGMDLKRWKEMGIPAEFARKQSEIVETLVAMGVEPTLTCAPYLARNRPEFGEHLAWSESSAVIFANSVIGARTNREGGPSALAAAIVGRTACYGFHTEQGRKPACLVEVACPLKDEADFGALGYLIGKKLGYKTPYIRLRGELPPLSKELLLRAMGAAMAASGSVSLFHVEGLTPEAEIFPAEGERLTIDSLNEAYFALSSPLSEVDLIWIGCPHASPEELELIASLVNGRKLSTRLWVTTSREIAEKAGKAVEVIEEAGGLVLSDTCLVVAPVEALGIKSVATNSAKAAFYLPSWAKVQVAFAPLEECLTRYGGLR